MGCAGGCGPGCCGDDDATIQVASGAPRLMGAMEPGFSGAGFASAFSGANTLSMTQATGRVTPLSFMPGFVPLFDGGGVGGGGAGGGVQPVPVLPSTDPPVLLACPIPDCKGDGSGIAFAAMSQAKKGSTAKEVLAVGKENAKRLKDATAAACEKAKKDCKEKAHLSCETETDKTCKCGGDFFFTPPDCVVLSIMPLSSAEAVELANKWRDDKDEKTKAMGEELFALTGVGTAQTVLMITSIVVCDGECEKKK